MTPVACLYSLEGLCVAIWSPGCILAPQRGNPHVGLMAPKRDDDAQHSPADVWVSRASSGSGVALWGERGDRAQVEAPRQRSGSVGHAAQSADNVSVAQEAAVVEFRRILLLPLDDLMAVTRGFLNPDVSPSGLHRCLRRHGVSNLKALLRKTPTAPRTTFKAHEPGFVPVDVTYLPQMANATTRPLWAIAGQSLAGQRVERFNGRIAEVLKTNRFDRALDPEQTLMRYVALLNTQLPQSALRSRTPMQAMKDWYRSHPHLFTKSPRSLPARDTKQHMACRKNLDLCIRAPPIMGAR